MKYCLRLTRLPELQHLPVSERRALVRRGRSQARLGWRWQTWLGSVVYVAFVLGWPILAEVTAVQFGFDDLDWRWLTLQIASAAVFSTAGALIYDQSVLGPLREAIRAQILAQHRGKRVPVCFECGYDLRGCPGRHCSECGFAIPDTGEPPPQALAA